LNASSFSLHCLDITIPGASIQHFRTATAIRAEKGLLNSATSTQEDSTLWQHTATFHHIDAPAARGLELTVSGRYETSQKRWDLDGLLQMCNGLEMTNPRDRVYALMHLANDYKQGAIIVDYSKSVIDVLVDAAAYIVQSECNLSFLKDAFLNARGDSSAVQEISERRPTWFPPAWFGEKPHGFFDEDYDITFETECAYDSVLKAHRRLRIRGLRVDRVGTCLTVDLDTTQFTARQLWDSRLGSYLLNYIETDVESHPPEVVQVLVGFAEDILDDFRGQLVAGAEASSSEALLDSANDAESDRNIESDVSEESESGDSSVDTVDLLRALHGGTILCLRALLNFSQGEFADQPLTFAGYLPTALTKDMDIATKVVTHKILDRLEAHTMIITESKKFGRVPQCAIKDGDEVWVALGCNVPIVVRPQPNGHYWFVCPAEIPRIQEHADLRDLTSDVQVSDTFGDWVVKDIELE
jgi:hypothetical protein